MGAASTAVTAVAFLWYFRSILKKDGSHLSRMTWLLLATIAWVVAGNSYLANATDTLGSLVMNAVGSTIVFLLSLRHGVDGWRRIDKFSFFFAVTAFSFSVYVNQPLVSIVLALSFDFFALLPTFTKLYERPHMEEASPWILTVAANFLNVFALGNWFDNQNSLEIILPPVYFLMANFAVLILIVRPRII